MEKIIKLWFDSNRICIQTDTDKEYSRPLEAFPLLLEATDEQRLDFQIGRFGDDVRWKEIDEDIHISSFIEDNSEPDYNNDIAKLFAMFPQLNVSEIARSIGINKSLLSKYIYGIKNPSETRKKQIISSLRELGNALVAATQNDEPFFAAEKEEPYLSSSTLASI